MSGLRYVLHNVFETGRAAEFLDAWQSRVLETRNDPGCLQYEIALSVDDPDRVIMLEHWQDQEHYDAHWRVEQQRGPWPGEDFIGDFTIEIYDNHAWWELGEDMTWRTVNR